MTGYFVTSQIRPVLAQVWSFAGPGPPEIERVRNIRGMTENVTPRKGPKSGHHKSDRTRRETPQKPPNPGGERLRDPGRSCSGIRSQALIHPIPGPSLSTRLKSGREGRKQRGRVRTGFGVGSGAILTGWRGQEQQGFVSDKFEFNPANQNARESHQTD